MKKLLIVTRHTPLPWEDGAGAYLHDLARFLAGHGFQVDVLWLAPHAHLRWSIRWRLPPAFDPAVHLHLAEGVRWGRTYFFPAVLWLPFKARLLHRARQVLRAVGIEVALRGKAGGVGPRVASLAAGIPSNGDGRQPWASPPSAAELDQVERFAKNHRPDVVIANFSWMGPVLELPSLQGARRVCLAHDVGWRRALLSAPPGGPEMSREDERRWLRPAGTIIAISESDAFELRALAPAAEMLVAPKALETLPLSVEGDSHRVIFVGSDNAFNVEGLEWFLRLVWPRVRQAVPDARLDVCGSIDRTVLLRPDGVTYHGTVPRLDAHYQQAAVAVVPLLRTTGLNIKLVEAAAFGRAIVVTPGTLEGAPFLRDAAIVAESPGEFATALQRLLGDRGLRAAAAGRALTAVQTHLAPATCYGPLAASLNLPAHRAPRETERHLIRDIPHGASAQQPLPAQSECRISSDIRIPAFTAAGPARLPPRGSRVVSPVIYIFFNRPGVTRRTFGALRLQRPARLHLIADGPRPSRPQEAALCHETRAIVEGLIDWPCTVTRDYAETNLGCGRRLSTGLTAAFALLGEAIVLEDDILPHPDFFPFCDAMLAAYRDDPHVHSISGFQPLGRYAPAQGPAVPSSFSAIWGWASWQRAWRDYRFDLSRPWANPKIREAIRHYVANEFNYQQHAHSLDELVSGRVDTWDFQWAFTQLAHHRVTLVSAVNLVQNLGFAADATHTVTEELYLRTLQVHPGVPTSHRRDTRHPDRFHDQLYGKVIYGRSAHRIALLRLLARFPEPGRRLLKTETVPVHAAGKS